MKVWQNLPGNTYFFANLFSSVITTNYDIEEKGN